MWTEFEICYLSKKKKPVLPFMECYTYVFLLLIQQYIKIIQSDVTNEVTIFDYGTTGKVMRVVYGWKIEHFIVATICFLFFKPVKEVFNV
jgi:hypothetical protein